MPAARIPKGSDPADKKCRHRRTPSEYDAAMRLIQTLLLIPLASVALPAYAFQMCGFEPPFANGVPDLTRDRPASDGFVDSDLYPIRVHYLTGNEDLVAPLMEAAELSWQFQIEDWGWDAPDDDGNLGGDQSIDFYLADTNFGGYASPDDYWSTGTQVRCSGHMVINRLMDANSIRITVPHEFNHLLQMWTDCIADPQLFEASAVYAQDWPYPELDSAWGFAAAFQEGFYRPLDYYDYAQPPQYGSFIFLQFLSERFGDGTPISTLELWQDATQGDWDNSNTWMAALERWLEAHWPEELPAPADGELFTELAWMEFGEWR